MLKKRSKGGFVMAWMMFAAVCAYFVKGLCGFANTLIFSSILSFRFDNISISPVELLLGNLPGVFLLKNAGAEWVKFFFGLVIMGLGVEMLIRERTAAEGRQVSKGVLVVIGILSGLLCGLYGIGALLAAYMSRVTKDSSAFKGNLCVVFLIENTFRIVMYAVTGILTAEVLKSACILLPAMAFGLLMGIKSSSCLKERTVRRAVIILLILSGVALVWKQIVD